MTYKFYKVSQNVLYLLIIPSILLWQFAGEIPWLSDHPLVGAITYYFICVLSIFILCFGVYAHVLKVKTLKKTDSPVVLIILGSLLTLLSYGSPIAFYFSYPDMTVQALSPDKLQTLSEEALNPIQEPGYRLSAAQVYYREARKSIEYLDLNGEKRFYSPDKSDEEYLQKREYLENRTIGRKISIMGHLGFTVASCFGFLVLLIWKIHSAKKKKGVKLGLNAE